MSNKRITEYKVGSDPEIFLVDKDSREIISAIPYIPGDKHNPYPIPGLPEGCMIQTDNVMIEFCLPATTNPKEFDANMRACRRYAESIVPAAYETEVRQSGRVSEAQLLDPRTQVFGCDPDYCVWTDGMPNDAIDSKTDLRTCGGHVHVGYNEPDMEVSMGLVKALDIFLGIPSVILDSDKERKKMYGKAGAFRFKPYGVEYRSLSNFWLASEELIETVFKGVQLATEFLNEGKLDQITDDDQLKIQTCINTGDETLALELVSRFNLSKLLTVAAVHID